MAQVYDNAAAYFDMIWSDSDVILWFDMTMQRDDMIMIYFEIWL